MGGAVRQHSAIGGLSSAPRSLLWSPPAPRWMIHTWSCSSTHAPMVQPKSQLLGSGFGQSGSTSNIGALTLEPCASALYCTTAWPTPRAMIAAASAATETNLRLCSSLVIVASQPVGSMIRDGKAPRPAFYLAAIIGERIALVRRLIA